MKLSYNQTKNNILNVKYSKNEEVFQWGDDNMHPSLIESLISMSVTSKRCVDFVAKAIYGKSFGEVGKVIVNKVGQSLNEVLRVASREYAKHSNCFIHVGYDGDLNIKSIKVIPATKIRIGKADDLGYSGKFIMSNDWQGRQDKENYTIYDRYNPDKGVITAQIEKAGGIQSYNGQIIHLQEDSNAIYSESDLFPVMGEALLERNSQTFRLNGSLKGFLMTKLMTVKPFATDDERRAFKRSLKDMQSVDNTGDVLLLETSQMTDNLDEQFKLDDLSSEFNDKLFEYSDAQGRENITIAFGVNSTLLSNKDGSMFGNSGELIKQIQLQLYNSREEERDMFEELFNKLMSKFQDKPLKGVELRVINPYTETTNIE